MPKRREDYWNNPDMLWVYVWSDGGLSCRIPRKELVINDRVLKDLLYKLDLMQGCRVYSVTFTEDARKVIESNLHFVSEDIKNKYIKHIESVDTVNKI